MRLELKARYILGLGMSGKQWLACIMICVMLLPMMSFPAAVYASPRPAGSAEFEPVNEELSFWTENLRDLNTRLESLTTPFRSGNSLYGEINGDKKKKDDEKKKKSSVTTETNPETAAKSEKAVEDSKSKTDKDEPAKTETPKVETGKTTGLKAPAPARNSLLLNLPDDEIESKYTYENNLGSPPGKTEADSTNEAAAVRIKHRVGAANFNFALSLASLAGRGIDAGVGLTYNSRTWNKSCSQYDPQFNCIQDHFTYDVEQSWIAPGFSSGLGYLESAALLRNVVTDPPNNDWHTEITPLGLTDADGTRHELDCLTMVPIPGAGLQQRCSVYGTTDGTFLRFDAKPFIDNPGNTPAPNTSTYSSTTFQTVYPGGTSVFYSGGFGTGARRRHYPIKIQDRNGNFIEIFYKSDQSGRIDYIKDTLNRQIKFYYENDANGNPDKLVAVTIPGMGTNEQIQTVRFYYETMTLQSGGFVSTAQVTAPSTIRVLKYLYMPATKTGFKYEYHSKYGMIKKITRQVGMTGSTADYNTTGTLTEGIFAASTEYNFPDGSTPQADVPKYTKRTDDWQGRTSSSAQETLYHVPAPANGENISIITVKDNGFDVVTENVSVIGGFLKETSVKMEYGSFSELMVKNQYTWTGTNLTKLETTNEAGLVKKTEYAYDQYNNQTQIKEYDYGTNSPTLLRTTDITYETRSNWIANNQFNLPIIVKTTVGSTVVSKTLYEYDHDGSDSTLVRRGDIGSLGTHNAAYNPEDPGYFWRTRYRGNLTKVTSFSDATLTSDSNADVKEYEYDIAGNQVTAPLSCCQLLTIEYGNDYTVTGYAYPVKETKGSLPTQLMTEATYNYNTGLITSSKDENAQTTTYEYETDSLRPKKTIYPNGGYVLTEYSDKLITTTNDLLPGFVRTTTTLDSDDQVQNYDYFNGGGLVIRNVTQLPNDWRVSAVEFDKLRRPFKAYNAFYGSAPTSAIPSGTKYTEVLSYDGLGRPTSVQLQDNTTISTEYSRVSTTPTGFAKNFVTVTDQAGKKNRQVIDALGRLVRVDEPDLNGNLGAVDSPNQPTFYEYDGNGNLSKITQSDGTNTQERLFKYDSLSRLTHEKQVEAESTLNNEGVKVTSGGLWTKVLKYSAHGLLTDVYDANGVNAEYSYDDLNRLISIEYSGEAGYQTPNIVYTYDEVRTGFYNKGQLTKATTAIDTNQGTPATEQIYDYDKMGQIVKHQTKINDQSYLLEYGYNLAGQLVSEKYPSGRIVNLGYDESGNVLSVADAQRIYLSNVSFGSRTLPTQMNLGNGTTQTFDYNDRLQLINQTWSRGSTVVQKYDYGFGQIDSNGNLDTTKNNGQLARVESHIGTSKQWTQKFKYDSIGRLKETEEKRGDTNALSYKQILDYDRFGNLYRKSASNPTTGQEHPLPFTTIEDSDVDRNKNRFTSGTGTSYDAAGQIVTDNKFRMMGFSYDANGRMIKATKANTPDALSVYDALGNRVAIKVNDVWQFVIYDAFGNLVAEYGGAVDSDEGGVSYILSDWQGSVRAVLNNAGYTRSRTDYQAFGEEIFSGIGLRTTVQGFDAGSDTRRGYALTERDEATGLNHTTFRKNENRAGRWTSPDPYNGSMNLDNPQSFNRYSYVENQPTNYVDPTGLLLAAPNWLQYNWVLWSAGCVQMGTSETGVYTYCNQSSPWNTPDPVVPTDEFPGAGSSESTPAANCSTEQCDQECMNREVIKCENTARKYFNDNVSWNVIKDVLGLPGSLVSIEGLRGMSKKQMLKFVAKFVATKVFWFAAVASAVYALYDTTQQAVAIENECRKGIPAKCGEGCAKQLPKVGRA